MEQQRRGCVSSTSQAMKMDKNFDSGNERECYSCFYDLHLSAAGCECSPNRFSCLTHAKDLCSCEPTRRFFLFRYSIDEVNTLVKALEGDLDAVHQWGSDVLRLVPPSDTLLEGPGDSKHRRPSNSNCCSEKQQLDINMTDVVASHQNNGYQVPKNIDYDPNKGYILDLQQTTKVESRRVSLVADDKWFPDLNTEQPSTKSKSAILDSHDNCKLEEIAVRGEQGCSPYLVNQAKPSTSLLAVVNKIRMEDESPRITDIPLRSSPECGSSISLNHSSEAATSSSFPTKKLIEASCSRDAQHVSKSTAKLFGFDLNQLQPRLSTPSDVEGNTKLTSLNPVNPETVIAEKRLRFSVEPLHFGTVMFGKRWCCREAIFPKGTHTTELHALSK